jgi:hypothetical protein
MYGGNGSRVKVIREGGRSLVKTGMRTVSRK